MRKYTPSGRWSFGRLVISLVVGGLGAAMIGVGLSALGRVFYLILIFPLFAGVIVGGVAAYLLVVGKCRNPTIAVAFGVALGAITFASQHYCGCCHLVLTVRTAMVEGGAGTPRGNVSFQDAHKAVDLVLRRDYGHAGVVGFMIDAAREGATISPVGGGDSTDLGFAGTWLLWAVEALILMAAAAWIARLATRHPFCESCGRWYARPKELFPSFELSSLPDVVGKLARGEYRDAGAAIRPCSAAKEFGKLMIARCPACDAADIALQVIAAKPSKWSCQEETVVLQGMVPWSEFAAFSEALQPRIPTE